MKSFQSFEVNVPFRDDGNGNPDWTTFQDVWWTLQDVIKEFEAKDLFPMDMVTEVRLVGGSSRLLDSYYGNKHGTISIDPIGSLMVPNWLWDEFKAAVFERFQKFSTDGGKVRMVRAYGKLRIKEMLAIYFYSYFSRGLIWAKKPLLKWQGRGLRITS